MSAESLAEFRAFMAEQEHKRQNPSRIARASRRLATRRQHAANAVYDFWSSADRHAHPVARRSLVVLGALALGAGLGTGAATAYWKTTATGSGTGTTVTPAAITVVSGTASGTALFPGLTANGTNAGGDLVVNVTNPNPFKVSVALSQRAPATATGCTTPDITFTGGTFTVGAGTVTPVSHTIPFSVGMGTGSTSDCQGKTFSVPVTATATSTTN